MAKVGGGKVSLLVVVPRPHVPASTDQQHLDAVSRLQAERPQRAEQYLQERVRELRARGLASVETMVRTGETADCITDVTREQGVDLIAMSTHGLGASGRYALGSVALKVLMTAPCPVFMARIQEAWSSAEA
ncbi:MAG: universal stress protein [Dehalococcoidia bacterium]|nr:universal stress protein [Dehalococcoidia bacterium]